MGLAKFLGYRRMDTCSLDAEFPCNRIDLCDSAETANPQQGPGMHDHFRRQPFGEHSICDAFCAAFVFVAQLPITGKVDHMLSQPAKELPDDRWDFDMPKPRISALQYWVHMLYFATVRS